MLPAAGRNYLSKMLRAIALCLFSIAIVCQVAFAQAATNAPIHLCHDTFSLATSRVFEFAVPANVLSPRLTGMVAAADSKIEVMLFNQQQYADFLKNQPGDAVFVNEIKTGNIDVRLSSISSQGQKYYLVLNNPSRHPQKVWADFEVKLD